MNAMALAGLFQILIPPLLSAVEIVGRDQGKSWEQILADVLSGEAPTVTAVVNHLTPGAPAAPALQ
jgi:hypothetical protein